MSTEPPPGDLQESPPLVDTSTALRAPAPESTRRPRGGPLLRIKARPRTIRDTPEEEEESKGLLETLLVGWTGSVLVHGLIVLLFVIIAFVLPGEPPPKRFDATLGSEFGEDAGFDRLGGLDEETVEPGQFDPTKLGVALSEEPGVVMDADAILNQAIRPQLGGGNPGAGGGAEFGVARFGEGLETIRGVEVKVGDPQFTLIWDSEADLDLHVLEPGGAHIYWSNRQGARGGELDVDDTNGFGPENVYWLEEGPDDAPKVKGQGPPGVYHWYVLYYGAGGFNRNAPPTRWKVRVKHNDEVVVQEGILRRVKERSKVYSLTVKEGDRGNLLDLLRGQR